MLARAREMAARAKTMAADAVETGMATMGGSTTTAADEFANAWRQVEYLQGDEVEPERRCEGLRASLRRINELLVDEDYRGLGLRSPQRLKEGEDAPECLEHLLKDSKRLGRLCSGCAAQPPEVRLVITEALSDMFASVRHPHFWGAGNAVQTPLAAFLGGCRDPEAVGAEGQEHLVRLLGSVCDKLRSCEAELLPFFFKGEFAAAGEDPFLVFSILLQYVGDSRDKVHETVRRSMLACVQLEAPAVSEHIAGTRLCKELSAGLAQQFNWVLEDGGGDVALFRLLEHCNHIAASCNSQALCDALSEALGDDFVGAVQDGLLDGERERCVKATCLARAVVVSLRKEEVREEDWTRAVDDVHALGAVEDIHRESHAAVVAPIVRALVEPAMCAALVERVEGRDEELALETLKLFASLLELYDGGVFEALVLAAVPAGTMAPSVPDFVASMKLHPCVSLDSLDGLDAECEEAYWIRRALAVSGAPPVQCTAADAPTAFVQALLGVLGRFHDNSPELNLVATVSPPPPPARQLPRAHSPAAPVARPRCGPLRRSLTTSCSASSLTSALARPSAPCWPAWAMG